jgi:mannose-6-phosphate isomerase-like protein (cupin superfamily)
VKPDVSTEFPTAERVWILESWNVAEDEDVSIARARVAPGVTTQLHRVDVDERYLVVEGRGLVHVGDTAPTEVGPGDVVVIPRGVPQRIANTGDSDLLFYCICSPRFDPAGYEALEG